VSINLRLQFVYIFLYSLNFHLLGINKSHLIAASILIFEKKLCAASAIWLFKFKLFRGIYFLYLAAVQKRKPITACRVQIAVQCLPSVAVGWILHKVQAPLQDFANSFCVRHPPIFESIHDGQVLDVLQQKPFVRKYEGGAKKSVNTR